MLKHNRTLILLVIAILTLSNIVLAADIPLNAPPQDIVTLDSLQNQIRSEGIQTRTELTAYNDRKISEMISIVKTDGQSFIDENFKIFDARIHDLVKQVQIQFTILVIAAIVAGNAIWYAMKKKIEAVRKPRPTHLSRDELTREKYGILTEEKKAQMREEDTTIIKQDPLNENRLAQPNPPSVTEIEKIIKQQKFESQRGRREKLEKEIKAKEEKKAKLAEKIAKKKQKKIFNGTKKLEKELQETIVQQEKQETEIASLEKPQEIDLTKLNE